MKNTDFVTQYIQDKTPEMKSVLNKLKHDSLDEYSLPKYLEMRDDIDDNKLHFDSWYVVSIKEISAYDDDDCTNFETEFVVESEGGRSPDYNITGIIESYLPKAHRVMEKCDSHLELLADENYNADDFILDLALLGFQLSPYLYEKLHNSDLKFADPEHQMLYRVYLEKIFLNENIDNANLEFKIKAKI